MKCYELEVKMFFWSGEITTSRAKPRYSERILQVPWPFRLYQGGPTVFNSSVVFSAILKLWVFFAHLRGGM